MSMRLSPFEAEILEELKTITKNKKLKGRDLLAWNTNEAALKDGMRDGEEAHQCRLTGVWAAIPKQIKK